MNKKNFDIRSILKSSVSQAKLDLGLSNKETIITEQYKDYTKDLSPGQFLPAPEIKSKSWGIKGTEDSNTLDTIISNISPGSGDSITRFITSIDNMNKILHVIPGKKIGLPVEEQSPQSFDAKSTFAALQLTNLFHSILTQQSAKSAGGIFESVIARMMGGETVPEGTGLIQDFVDAEGNPVSLKVLVDDSNSTIHGSPTDLARSIVEACGSENVWDKGIKYLVVLKNQSENAMKISAFSFMITKDNYFNFMLQQPSPVSDLDYDKIYNFVRNNYYEKNPRAFDVHVTSDDPIKLWKIKTGPEWQSGEEGDALKTSSEVAVSDEDKAKIFNALGNLAYSVGQEAFIAGSGKTSQKEVKFTEDEFKNFNMWLAIGKKYGFDESELAQYNQPATSKKQQTDFEKAKKNILFSYIRNIFLSLLNKSGFSQVDDDKTLSYADYAKTPEAAEEKEKEIATPTSALDIPSIVSTKFSGSQEEPEDLEQTKPPEQQLTESMNKFIGTPETFNQAFYTEYLNILPIIKQGGTKYMQGRVKPALYSTADLGPLNMALMQQLSNKFYLLNNLNTENIIYYVADASDPEQRKDLKIIFSGKNDLESINKKRRIIDLKQNFYNKKFANAIKRLTPLITFVDYLLTEIKSNNEEQKAQKIEKGFSRKNKNIFTGIKDEATGKVEHGEVWKLINLFFHGPLNKDSTATTVEAGQLPGYLKKQKVDEARTAASAGLSSGAKVEFSLKIRQAQNIAILCGADYKDDYPELLIQRELLFTSAQNSTNALKEWIEPIFKELYNVKVGLDQYYIHDQISGMVQAQISTQKLEEEIFKHVQRVGDTKASELRENKFLQDDFFSDILKKIL